MLLLKEVLDEAVREREYKTTLLLNSQDVARSSRFYNNSNIHNECCLRT